MDDQVVRQKEDRLIRHIREQMHHSFLAKHTELPHLDEEKAIMLYRMFLDTKHSEEHIFTYVTTVMLVQAALDAHDTISVTNKDSETSKTRRQLVILGGDYYSGLYYALLTKMGEIRFIRKLARSIQQVNEHKMFLYNDADLFEQSVDHLRIIETALLKDTADYFHLPLWGDFMEHYFFMRRLMAERRSHLSATPTKVTKSLYDSARFQPFTKLIDPYIVNSIEKVKRLFAIDSTFQRNVDVDFERSFIESAGLQQKLAEEG
ncbi:MAG TPA: heptaprenyl diphosphate synthase component 1 [Bacillales bacterium]|nr:heptaprenyl diphosphate synthase component 1 [Bacillales bacterium]